VSAAAARQTKPAEFGPAPEPQKSCALCPRLVDYRRSNKAAYPGYFNGPAPSFGPADARLLIVGLAPGLHGANRTGRPFTGDYAGDLYTRRFPNSVFQQAFTRPTPMTAFRLPGR